MPSRKTLFRIHSWLGLNLGLLLFIVCFSGTVATLSNEIDWLLNPALRADSRGPPTWSWERWHAAVRDRHPDASLLDKQFYIYPGVLPHGIYAVGPLAIVLLLSAITALAFYRIKWKDLLLRQRSASARRWWSSLHRASGVWTLLLTLILAVTGIWYLVERAAFDVGMPIGRAEVLAVNAADEVAPGSARLDLDSCVNRAQAAFAELDVRSIFFAPRDSAAGTLYGQADAWLVRDAANYVVVNPYTGTVVNRQAATDLPLGSRLMQMADPLHFGTFGSLPTKLLWFFAGSLISMSILAGVRIWHIRVNQSLTSRSAPAAGITRAGLVVTLGVLALMTYGSIVNIGESIAHGGSAAPGPEAITELVPPYVWAVVGGFVICTAVVTIVLLTALRPRLHRR